MHKLTMTLTLATMCLIASACNDDGPVKPEEFAVTINVTDLAGEPVEGLRVGLVNDHIFFQGENMTAKAAVSIPFRTELPVHVRLTVEDIEGRAIRLLYDGDHQPGVYRLIWDGRNDAGVHQPSGRYTVHLVGTNPYTGYWVFEDRTDMLLAMLDSSRVPAGFTDQGGRLVLKEQMLFPHLYDRPDLFATDENGQIIGVFNLTPLMRISLTDTTGGGSMWIKTEVGASETLNLTWNPTLATADRSPSFVEGIFPGTARTDKYEPNVPPFELGLVYPNPFN